MILYIWVIHATIWSLQNCCQFLHQFNSKFCFEPQVYTFKGPHWCDFCRNFLWGLIMQGVKCQGKVTALNLVHAVMYIYLNTCIRFNVSSQNLVLHQDKISWADNSSCNCVCCHLKSLLLTILCSSRFTLDCGFNAHKQCSTVIADNCQPDKKYVRRGMIYIGTNEVVWYYNVTKN